MFYLVYKVFNIKCTFIKIYAPLPGLWLVSQTSGLRVATDFKAVVKDAYFFILNYKSVNKLSNTICLFNVENNICNKLKRIELRLCYFNV